MEQEEPIQPEVRQTMADMGHAIDEVLNPGLTRDEKKWGFALLIFPFGVGADHRSNYISNARREDMLATMKEFIARAEGTFEEGKSQEQ